MSGPTAKFLSRDLPIKSPFPVTCKKCGETKDISLFPPRVSRTGKADWCKKCKSKQETSRRNKKSEENGGTRKTRIIKGKPSTPEQRENNRIRMAQKRASDPDKYFEKTIWGAYRMTLSEYNGRLAAQGYKCDCCGKPFDPKKKEPCIEHNHNCCPGQRSCGLCVRGLLCRTCNIGLGFVENNQHLSSYLEGRQEMFQKVILMGSLGKDPEKRATVSGSTVTNFTVAVDEGYGDKKHTEWFRVVSFGKTAENAATYLKKGSEVVIDGRLQTRKWENKQGEAQYTTEVVADNIRFAGRSGSSRDGGGQQRSGTTQPRQKAAPQTRSTPAPADTMNTTNDWEDDPDGIPF